MNTFYLPLKRRDKSVIDNNFLKIKTNSLLEEIMFKNMRRDEKKLSKEKAFNILKEGDYGILATFGKDGYPYGVPMNYILYKDKIFLHCAPEGHKLENLKHNNKVSFTVVGSYELKHAAFTSKYESVIIFGKANIVKGEIKKEVLQEYIIKFSPEFKTEGFNYIEKAVDETTIIQITIEDIKGKKND